MRRIVTVQHSFVKATTYRVLIMAMDFATIYLFTGVLRVALGFMVASNIYTTLAYLFHERLWARISWGIDADDGWPTARR
jgi:uncharacterized membrane protein